jgi:CheY-like chemotaxis protein
MPAVFSIHCLLTERRYAVDGFPDPRSRLPTTASVCTEAPTVIPARPVAAAPPRAIADCFPEVALSSYPHVPDAVSVARTSAKTILVVDDDATIRGLIRRVLSMRGFHVLDVADGRVALDLARTEDIDLVITDLVMPEIEGLETIRLLKRERPSLEILAVSGAYGGAFLHAAALLGARSTLAKPFDADTLLAAVEGIVGAPS